MDSGQDGHHGRRAAPPADGRDGSECACATTRDLRTAGRAAREDAGRNRSVPDVPRVQVSRHSQINRSVPDVSRVQVSPHSQ